MKSEKAPDVRSQDSVDKQVRAREEAMEAMYSMIVDAGLFIGAADPRASREALADNLSRCMSPDDLDRLIGWASRQTSCDDWRGLLVSKLRDGEAWGQILKDLKHTARKMKLLKGNPKKDQNVAGSGSGKAWKNSMDVHQRVFYAWWYDRRRAADIAEELRCTPTRVLTMMWEWAEESEDIPEATVTAMVAARKEAGTE